MTSQTEEPDDLIAELTKLMASDAREARSTTRGDAVPSPQGKSGSIRIPGSSEPLPPVAARHGNAAPSSPELVANWQDRLASAQPSGGNRTGTLDRREPSFSRRSEAAASTPPSGFEFDFGFNRERPQGPTSSTTLPKQAAGQSTEIVPASPSHDLIADLIAAELDHALPTPTNVSKPVPAAPKPVALRAPAQLPPPAASPTALADNARLAEPQPVRPAPMPTAPRPGAESDRFVTAPVFGLGNRPAGESGPSRPDVDPIDEIESLIGEAVRVELNAAPPAPGFSREPSVATVRAPAAESRPAVTPPAQLTPRRSVHESAPPAAAEGPEDAILAAAAVNGTEVGRVDAPYGEPRQAPGKQRARRDRKAREDRRPAGFIRGFVVPMLAGTLLVVIGFGVYWGFGFAGQHSGKAPILTADVTPAKTIPPKLPAAAPSSVVMQELSGNTPPANRETLVSRDQTAGATPAQVAAPTPAVAKIADAADNGLANRKVRTVTVRPDGTIVSGDDSVAGGTELPVSRPNVPAVPGVSTAEAAEAPSSAAVMPNSLTPPAANAPGPVIPAAGMTVASVDPSTVSGPSADVDAPMPMARAMRPESSSVASADAATAGPSSPVNAQIKSPPAPRGKPLDLIGSLVNAADAAPARPATRLASLDTTPVAASTATAHVQLASQPSEAAAENSATTLEQRYGNLFNGVTPAVIKADVSGRGVHYRVVIPASSLAGAQQLCSAIKAKGGDCFAYNG